MNQNRKLKLGDLTATAVIFYLVALGCIIFGLVTAYYYPDYSVDDLGLTSSGNSFNHVVGGDSYNFIIMGARGLLWTVLGLISALIGSTVTIVRVLIGKADIKQTETIINTTEQKKEEQ